jgi:hypothetical protein
MTSLVPEHSGVGHTSEFDSLTKFEHGNSQDDSPIIVASKDLTRSDSNLRRSVSANSISPLSPSPPSDLPSFGMTGEKFGLEWHDSEAARGAKYEIMVPGFKMESRNIFIARQIFEDTDDVTFEYMHMLYINNAYKHRFLVFSSSPDRESDPKAMLVELLAQPQCVLYQEHKHENEPYEVIDSVQISPITLADIIAVMQDPRKVKDHHIWNELAHGRFRSYNECIHLSCHLWNQFKADHHQTYRSSYDMTVGRCDIL